MKPFFGGLQRKAGNSNIHVLLAELKACSRTQDLQRGKKVHAEAVAYGHDSDVYLVSALIRMYAKCGSVADARRVFNSVQNPDVVCWNALLHGYAEKGEGLVALDLFYRMKASGCAPNSATYVAALKACTALAVHGDGNGSGKKTCLERGKDIHSEVGSNLDLHIQSTLIDMYAKCGSTLKAREAFDSIAKPNTVCWTALLLAYAENGEGVAALDVFSRMKASGCVPDSVTYVAALKACTSLAVDGDKKECLKRGKDIHSEINTNLSHQVQNMLIDMYAKCGSMVDARLVFDSIRKPDVVSWTALLLGYAENGEGFAALDMFSRMKAIGCEPNSVTYIAAIKACTSLAVAGDSKVKKNCFERGKEIHSEIGNNLDTYVQNTLIDMYAKCGRIDEARRVFEGIQKPNVVSWTALILGYAENGEGLFALDLFTRMKFSGCAPNSVTYIAALKACSMIGALAFGRNLHAEITNFNSSVVTCLVDFYGKCGSMVEAHEVFGLHPKARSTAAWNALLAGYGRFGDSDTVFKLFEAMQDEGFHPDAVTFVCLLSCCSHAGLVEKAREHFDEMDIRYGIIPDVTHYSCMIDVLGRANLLNEAVSLLQKMPCNPDAITWMGFLGACRKREIVEVGRMASQTFVGKDEKLALAHAVINEMYGSNNNLMEQEKTDTEAGAWKPRVFDEVGVKHESACGKRSSGG